MKPESKKTPWPWVAAIGIMLAGSTAYVAWDHLRNPADFRAASAGLEKSLARAKAAGVPLSVGGLPYSVQGPESEDLAPLFADFGRELDRLSLLGDAIDVRSWRKVKETLPKFKPQLDLADQSGGKTYLSARQRYRAGAAMGEPEYVKFASIRLPLLARAIVASGEGNVEGAIESLSALRRLGRIAGSDSSRFSRRTEENFRNDAAELAIRLASGWRNDAESLARLKGALTELPPLSEIRVLKAEAYAHLLILRNTADRFNFSNPMQSKKDDPSTMLDESAIPGTTRGRAIFAKALDAYAEMFEKAAAKPGDDREMGRQYLAVSAAIFQRMLQSELEFKRTNPMAAAQHRQAPDPVGSLLARERIARAYAAVLEHRARTGRLPATLAEAGAALPDPFGQGPLSYQAAGDCFRVWSIGFDGRDNGGRTSAEIGRPGSGDITTAFPPVLATKQGAAWHLPGRP